MLIPYVMDFNLPAAEATFALIAQAMGESTSELPARRAAAAAVDAVKVLCRDIGIPASLKDLGIPASDVPRLVESALKVTRPVENNPRTLGEKEAEGIYKRAFS